MQTIPLRTAPQPWYTQRWPWLLMLGPALVVVAGVITGVVAYQRQDAMVVDDYYKRGKTINMDLRRDRVASAMRLALSASYDPTGATLRGNLSSFGKAYRAPFSIALAHATQPQKDIALSITPDQNGNFSVPLAKLEAGRWQVVVEAAGREWRLASQWRWPLQPAVSIEADKELAR